MTTRVDGTTPVVATCTTDTGPRPTNTSAGVFVRTFGKSRTTRAVPSPYGVTDSAESSPFPVSVTLAPAGSASPRTDSSIVAKRPGLMAAAAATAGLVPAEPSGNAV